ncbi:MAG: LysR family transcriptional regulator [Lachnospiraceae bacterium]|nr:LysR family transcriptional regulator [Lachnospiraceae bacterium]
MTTNLEYYKVFYYVAKLGRITDAATKLNISQPAVSQSLKQLEKQLGTMLFARTPKGVKLTQEGEVLFSYVSQGYEQIILGEKKLAEMTNLEAGEIHIGASDMTLRFFLLPYLEKFHEAYPKIKVVVTNAPSPETLEYLENGKIDFGVVSTPFEIQEHVQVRCVKDIQDTFVCGRKFEELKGKIISFEQLGKLPIISLEGKTSSRAYVDEFLAKENVVLSPEFELATSDMIVQFALRNLGVGMVMKSFADEEIKAGNLFELQFAKPIPQRKFCVVADSRRPVSSAAQGLLDIIFASQEAE